jgi:hypothetical protein
MLSPWRHSANILTGVLVTATQAGSTNAYDYGKMLALRYAQHPNIVWHVEGDFEWSPSDSIGQQVDAVFHGINDGEGSNQYLINAEQQNGLTGYKQFILSKGGKSGYHWFIQGANTLYNYGSNSVDCSMPFRKNAGRPVTG